jgi:hypothetical protein
MLKCWNGGKIIMKTVVRLFFASLLATPLMGVGIVAAQEAGTTTENTTTTTTQTETSVNDKTALQERLTKRKAELKTKLTALQQKRLQERCKSSQGKLSSISGRIKGLETSRGEVYTNLVNRLTKLSDRLNTQGVDVTELNTEITNLKALIETFNTDLAAYKQAVSDLAAMDCASDATAFKASLDAARTAREKTAADAAAIKAYVQETIKPTLVTLKKSVEAQKPETETQNTEGAN